MRGRAPLAASPRPSCSPIHCSSNSLTGVSASACTPVRIGKTIVSLLLNSKILMLHSPHSGDGRPASPFAMSSQRDKSCLSAGSLGNPRTTVPEEREKNRHFLAEFEGDIDRVYA